MGAASALDYSVRFDVQIDEKRQGSFTVTVREAKAPLASKRFLEMVNSGFFNGNYFFRVVPGFIVQFGLSGNRTRQQEWDLKGPLPDETSVSEPDWNMRGTIAFANNGRNTRGTQVFVNYDDNHALDANGVVPFGRLVSGMSTVTSLYAGYRERPQQSLIRSRGDPYLWSEFPRLSHIISAQQVAFVEEPFSLSKNFTGLLLTLGMVTVAGLCCFGFRLLQKMRPGDDDDDDDDFERPTFGEGDEGEDEALGGLGPDRSDEDERV